MNRCRLNLFYALPALLTAFLIVAGISPAMAADGEYDRTAPSGEIQWMDEYSGWNNDCSFLEIAVDVIEQPAHGEVFPRPEIKRIPKKAVRGNSGVCAGRKMKALVLYYTSEPGYRGQDRFQVRMKVRGQDPAFFIYNVTVE